MLPLQDTCTRSSNVNNKVNNKIIGINEELCELSLFTSPTTQSSTVVEESDLEVLWPSVDSHTHNNDISRSTSTSYALISHHSINDPNQLPNSLEGNPINLDLTI